MQVNVSIVTSLLSLFQIQVLPQGSFVRKEFSPDRVKIIIDGEGKVVKAPSIGWPNSSSRYVGLTGTAMMRYAIAGSAQQLESKRKPYSATTETDLCLHWNVFQAFSFPRVQVTVLKSDSGLQVAVPLEYYILHCIVASDFGEIMWLCDVAESQWVGLAAISVLNMWRC